MLDRIPAGGLPRRTETSERVHEAHAHVSREAELRSLYEHSRLGIAAFDHALRFVRINETLAGVNGVPVGEHIGRTVAEVLPVLAPQVETVFTRVLATGLPHFDIEIVGETPAQPGVQRSWQESVLPIRDSSGTVIGVTAVIEETTELRRLNSENSRVTTELAASDARYQFLLHLHDELRRLDGSIEIHHRASCLLGEHLGLDRVGYATFSPGQNELADVGRHFSRLAPMPMGAYRVSDFGADFLEALRAGRTVVRADVANDATIEAPQRAAHAALGVGATVTVPVLHHGRLTALLFVHSATPRRWRPDEVTLMEAVGERTEDALRRAVAIERLSHGEHRLRLALKAGQLGIYDCDLVTDHAMCDERVRNLIGLAPDDPPSFVEYLAAVPAEERRRLTEAWEGAQAPGGSGMFVIEHRIRSRADGVMRHVVLTGIVMFDGSRAVRIVGTAQDISALRTAELALREADRRKDEFLAMLAHELRNPLAPMRNALRVFEHEDLSEAGRQALGMGRRQVVHLTRLVDDLLEVSRVTRGLIDLRPENVMIQHVVYAVVEGLVEHIDERRIQLTIDMPSRPLQLRADPVRLAQIVENLLNNACKYTDAGGEVSITVREHEEAVEVEVKDNGIGIEPDHLQQIFGLFTQVDSAIDRSRGGLGIGLHLVRHLVALHGGTVSAQSEGPGAGSRFLVTLPITDAHAQPDARQRAMDS